MSCGLPGLLHAHRPGRPCHRGRCGADPPGGPGGAAGPGLPVSTQRSAPGCSSARAPPSTTSATSSPSSASPPAASSTACCPPTGIPPDRASPSATLARAQPPPGQTLASCPVQWRKWPRPCPADNRRDAITLIQAIWRRRSAPGGRSALPGKSQGVRRRNPLEKGGTPVKAVRFDEYGGIDVLKVVDVPAPGAGRRPGPGPGQGGRDQPGRGQDPARACCTPVASDLSRRARAATWPGSSPRPAPE